MTLQGFFACDTPMMDAVGYIMPTALSSYRGKLCPLYNCMLGPILLLHSPCHCATHKHVTELTHMVNALRLRIHSPLFPISFSFLFSSSSSPTSSFFYLSFLSSSTLSSSTMSSSSLSSSSSPVSSSSSSSSVAHFFSSDYDDDDNSRCGEACRCL